MIIPCTLTGLCFHCPYYFGRWLKGETIFQQFKETANVLFLFIDWIVNAKKHIQLGSWYWAFVTPYTVLSLVMVPYSLTHPSTANAVTAKPTLLLPNNHIHFIAESAVFLNMSCVKIATTRQSKTFIVSRKQLSAFTFLGFIISNMFQPSKYLMTLFHNPVHYNFF